MVDASTFNLQPNFPIAGVADLYANRPYKEALMRSQQQHELVEGMKTFGAGVDSLVQRRMQMAQALAGAQMYAQTPEGQQMMAPTITRSQQPVPLMQNQTAQGTDDQGNILQAPIPNDGTSPVGMRPQVTTTSTPSPIDINTIATAFRGETPTNILSNISAQQSNKRAYDLEAMKETNAQKIAEDRLQGLLAIFKGNLGAKYAGINEQAEGNVEHELSSLKADQTNLIKQFPGIGTSIAKGLSFGLYQGSEEAQQAKAKYDENARRIKQLESGRPSSGGAGHPTLDKMTAAEKLALYNAMPS